MCGKKRHRYTLNPPPTYTPARDPDNNGLLDKVICHKLCKPLLPPDLPGLMEFWECSPTPPQRSLVGTGYCVIPTTACLFLRGSGKFLQVEMSLYTLFGGANFDDVMRESISSGKLRFLGFCGIKISWGIQELLCSSELKIDLFFRI